jgi:2-iminobutanoate/2-iminopropanoate deaminase
MAMETNRKELLALQTNNAPKPFGHYSQAIRFGDMVFISGQLPVRSDGTSMKEFSFEEQAEQALRNVAAIIKAAGGSPESIVKTTAYIVGIKNWSTLNRVYSAVFGDWQPARAVVPVTELHYGYLIEVEAVGVVSEVQVQTSHY